MGERRVSELRLSAEKDAGAGGAAGIDPREGGGGDAHELDFEFLLQKSERARRGAGESLRAGRRVSEVERVGRGRRKGERGRRACTAGQASAAVDSCAPVPGSLSLLFRMVQLQLVHLKLAQGPEHDPVSWRPWWIPLRWLPRPLAAHLLLDSCSSTYSCGTLRRRHSSHEARSIGDSSQSDM